MLRVGDVAIFQRHESPHAAGSISPVLAINFRNQGCQRFLHLWWVYRCAERIGQAVGLAGAGFDEHEPRTGVGGGGPQLCTGGNGGDWELYS